VSRQDLDISLDDMRSMPKQIAKKSIRRSTVSQQ